MTILDEIRHRQEVRRSTPSNAVVEVRDVARDYDFGEDKVHALKGVTFDIGEGDYVAIAGPSGCGKSTLLNMLGVIDTPTRGTVRIRGHDVGAMRDREATSFRLHNVGFVFQRFYLMPTLTAVENIELPMAEAGRNKIERQARARELLSYVGLGHRENHRPAQLSGGEQQRVAIARALANKPAIILADEPTGELDAKTGSEVISLFEQLNFEGATIIVVTHDEDLAHAAKRRFHMRDGLIVDG